MKASSAVGCRTAVRDPAAEVCGATLNTAFSQTPAQFTPQLIFDEKRDLRGVLERFLPDERAAIVTDPFNLRLAKQFGNSLCVESNDLGNFQIPPQPIDRVIAIGGCTALDMGRYLAKELSCEVICVPTLISSACLASNRAVVYRDGVSEIVRTPAPSRVVVSLPELMSPAPHVIARWSASGLGDMLARIGRGLDIAAYTGRADNSAVAAETGVMWQGFAWLEREFSGYTPAALRRITQLSFDTSSEANAVGITVGGEHDFYYSLIRFLPARQGSPTHGQIVGVGTLLAASLFGALTSNTEVYERLRRVFEKIGLPVDAEGIRRIGLESADLHTALDDMAAHSFFNRPSLLRDHTRIAHQLVNRQFERR